MHPTWSGDGNEFSDEEYFKLVILNNQLFRHKVMHVNFTTYDVSRGQDSLNSRNHADVMVLSRNETATNHPFEYARIIGIFHVETLHNVAGGASDIPTMQEALWVCWFKVDGHNNAGFAKKCLHRVEFLPSSNPNAFGFLDPDEVIHTTHLIPAFHHGPTEEFLCGLSVGRAEGEVDDWQYFYVNM